jgi:hypothetical protein
VKRHLQLVVLALLITVFATTAQVNEYQVKAAFLFNLARFVEWPPLTAAASREPFGICILGKNPFGSTLDEAVQGKTIGGRVIAVRLISGVQRADGCQILFVTSAEARRFKPVAYVLKGKGVLTVGEVPGFIGDGGIVNLSVDGGRLRFEINPGAAEEQQIRISSKLLSLAQIVR